MRKIRDLKIGKKIGLGLGAVVLLTAGLAGLAVWSVQEIRGAMQDSEKQSRMMTLAERVSSDTGGIAQLAAVMTLSKQAGAENLAELKVRRTDYLAAFEELKASVDTEADRRQLGEIEQVVTKWREADNKLIALLQAGKAAEAARIHEESVLPRFKELASLTRQYMKSSDEILAGIHERAARLISRTRLALMFLGLISVAGAIAIGLALTASISKPLTFVVANLGQISEGDLTGETPAELLNRGDEIGTLARATHAMSEALRKMIHDVSGGIRALSASSTEMMATSGQMTSDSQEASGRAHSVSAAAEEMSSNIATVASGMEQTTTNLSRVSSATEQMTATIGEIAQNSEKARRITAEATREAAHITEQIDQLGVAAREIGKVTETITEISSQTNLLALNATIEAARAGAAGKGFAVVATEIKALAQQTAAATEDIKVRITGVQSATSGGIAAVGKVSQVITEISGIVGSIAAAIEEQATATKDIARNIAEASAGVTDSNTRVAETAQVSGEIAKDIVGVDRAVGEMAGGSDHVRSNASDLAAVAETLRETMSHFHA